MVIQWEQRIFQESGSQPTDSLLSFFHVHVINPGQRISIQISFLVLLLKNHCRMNLQKKKKIKGNTCCSISPPWLFPLWKADGIFLLCFLKENSLKFPPLTLPHLAGSSQRETYLPWRYSEVCPPPRTELITCQTCNHYRTGGNTTVPWGRWEGNLKTPWWPDWESLHFLSSVTGTLGSINICWSEKCMDSAQDAK